MENFEILMNLQWNHAQTNVPYLNLDFSLTPAIASSIAERLLYPSTSEAQNFLTNNFHNNFDPIDVSAMKVHES